MNILQMPRSFRFSESDPMKPMNVVGEFRIAVAEKYFFFIPIALPLLVALPSRFVSAFRSLAAPLKTDA
jgi:hypothetical protein